MKKTMQYLKYYLALSLVGLVGILLASEAYAKDDCMKMGWKRGKPFNYYAAETRQSTGTFQGGLLYLVESAHFTRKVRRLQEGNTDTQPGDLLFVLGSIPNHPAALDAYARYEYLWETSKSFKANKDTAEPRYDAGCFFAKADMVFPGNASTSLTWGIYHFRRGEHQKALEKFLKANKLEPNSAEILYNTGLAYAEVKDLDNAKKFAAKAYALGYPLPGLKYKIAELEKAQ